MDCPGTVRGAWCCGCGAGIGGVSNICIYSGHKNVGRYQYMHCGDPFGQTQVGQYFSMKNRNISLIGTANNIGTIGKGNHQHNDFLSFELYGISPFIVDPWSYCYTGDKYLRNKDRKTKSHNCVEIDNREIVPFHSDKLFEMTGKIKVNIRKIEETTEHWFVSLTHNGYKILKIDHPSS